MSEENVEVVREGYAAFNRRDLDALLACMDPEVEFTTRFMQMENRAYDRGHSGIRDWWRDTFAAFPDYRAEILEVRDLGDAGIAALRVRGHGADSGAPFDERLWLAVKVRNGKVIWWSTRASEAEALEAAGLSE
jgi:ketosteroid isomerase-like protein